MRVLDNVRFIRTSYTIPTALFTCGTLGSDEKAHDYVLIAGTKWATMNIGAIEITGTNSYDKSSALLFFPAAGYGDEISLHHAGTYGFSVRPVSD